MKVMFVRQQTIDMSLNNPIHPQTKSHSQVEETVRTIPIVQEVFEAEKVLEHTGTVRVRKVVHTDRQSVDMDGFVEMIETETRPVGRLVESVQAPREEGGVLIIPVYEERLVKQLFLREELHLTRRQQMVSAGDVTLRREEVVVERLDPVTREWVADSGHP